MTTNNSDLKSTVQQRYGEAALRVLKGSATSCCGPQSCDPITANLYDASQVAQIPEEAIVASLGCGNPTALAEENKRKSGLTNVEFLKGEIENIPLPDNSVDVILSNCVINLSADKDRVLREAFRVLKPGGRFAVSDVVSRGEVPAEIRRSVELWIGCIAGALTEDEYREKLESAGFADVRFEPTRVYRAEDAREFLAGKGVDFDRIAPLVDGKFLSAFIRATRP